MFVFYRYISNFKLTINLVWSDIASSLHQDSIHGVNNLDPETPHQDPQKTCTRNASCLQQGFMICSTLNTHICNLDVASPTSPTIANRSQPPINHPQLPINHPQPPINHPQPLITHPILILTTAFQEPSRRTTSSNWPLSTTSTPRAMKSNLDFFLYDHSNLCAVHKIAMQILNSHVPTSIPLPAPPPSASFKPPKLVTDNWSGQSYNFYPWLSSVLNGFSLTRCDNPAKLVLTLQVILLNKRGSFNNSNNWTSFKTRLVEELGSINIFGHDVNLIFDLLPRYESVQEIELPKI